MATTTTTLDNPLLSNQTTSELQVILHPLVLLTISDYITRHTLQNHKNPVVGALLGRQDGREITMEHAFECPVEPDASVMGGFLLSPDKFTARLDQMRTVHQDNKLDLVGWYTLLPKSGPSPTILPIHSQILTQHNDSALLLGFHPDEVINHTVGANLPLSIYESLYEVDDQKSEEDDGDKKMDDGESKLKLRFRNLPYTVEAGDAEMISMDFVAKNSGNASTRTAPDQISPAAAADRKGKKKAADGDEEAPVAEFLVLSREEDAMVNALVAKSNAVKMLVARIELIIKYLESLPSSDLSDEAPSADAPTSNPVPSSHSILRQIQALVARLELVVPANEASFQREMQEEANDVNAISLLDDILQSASSLGEVGRKFSTAENSKARNRAMVAFQQAPGVVRDSHVLL